MELIPGKKWMVYCGSGAIFMLLYLTLFVLPTLNRVSYLKEAVPKKEKEVGEMEALSQEYLGIKAETDAYNRILSGKEKESIFSILEKAANSKGLSGNISSMKPLASSVKEGDYEEVGVQVKMTDIKLRDIVGYLYAIENPPYVVKIRELHIRPEKSRLHLEVDFKASRRIKKS